MIIKFASPAIVDIELTQRCSQKCSFCITATSDTFNKRRNEMNLQQLISIADQLQDLGVHHVFFTGGEPTIRKDFVEIVKEFIDRNIYPSVSTNGLFLNKEILSKLLDIGYNTLHFSIEGPKKIHEKITGLIGSYDKAITNLKKSLEMGFISAVSSVGINNNYDYLPKLVDDLEEVNPKAYRILRFFPTSKESLLLLPSIDQIKKNVPIIASKCKEYKIPFFVKFPPGVVKEKKDKDVYEICLFCEAGKIRLDILADGSVVPCKFFKKPDFILGNVTKDKLKHIWKSDKLKQFRLLTPKKYTGKCKMCSWKYHCYSCRAMSYNHLHNLTEDDLSCFKLRD